LHGTVTAQTNARVSRAAIRPSRLTLAPAWPTTSTAGNHWSGVRTVAQATVAVW